MAGFAARHQVAFFYLVAFALVIPCGLLMGRFVVAGQPGPLAYLFSTIGAASPLLALVILNRLTAGAVSVRSTLAKIRVRGAAGGWLFAAGLLQPLLVVAAGLIAFAGRPASGLGLARPETAAALGAWLVPAMLAHFGLALFTSPLLEEPGWRGFAIEPLQARFGREFGSLVVALAWWAWQQPLSLALGVGPTWFSAAVMVLVSFLIDSFYNLSGRNLAAAMLAHQASGTANLFLRPVEGDLAFLALLALAVITLRVLEQRRSAAPRPAGAG